MRTIDLGADKLPSVPFPEDEANPFLGLRSIRLALQESRICSARSCGPSCGPAWPGTSASCFRW